MTKWMEEQFTVFLPEGDHNTDWQYIVQILARNFVPEGDRSVLSPTVSTINADGRIFEGVSLEDFRTLAEKFLLACCYIKELEAHNETQENQNAELYRLVHELKQGIDDAQKHTETARALLQGIGNV